MATEAEIQKLIFCEFANRAVIVPNCYLKSSRFEMDCLVLMNKSGMTYEYEIKCTHSDFLNEQRNMVKKAKHRYLSESGRLIERIFANYYSFVCPEDVIQLDELWDDRYGLWYVYHGYMLKCIRRPKKIHDARLTDSDHWHLLKKLMYKYFNHADKYRIRKRVR